MEHLKGIESFDLICGVPYTALPIATGVSMKMDIPMVMRRKEAKSYGTKKLIEGSYKEGDRCLIIEDVVTSGSSVLETVKDLNDVGIYSKECIILLNREQGGAKILKNSGITLHALLTITQLMQYLKEESCISESVCKDVARYLAETQVEEAVIKKEEKNRLKHSYISRAKFAKNPIAKKLFQIMTQKQTNLCLAADVTKMEELLNLAEQTGPYICVLKTHMDIIKEFQPILLQKLKSIAKLHNFLLFEDRKFADIGKICELQYSEGLHEISSWANIVTAHSLTGKGVLDAIKQSSGLEERGVFLLAETSASGSLIDENYTKHTLELAEQYEDLITGIVCQNPLFQHNLGFIQLTPGVQLDIAKDNLGQQYNSPECVIIEKGADVAVVGRGITQSTNPAVCAEKYKTILWEAYLKRIE